MGTIQELQTLVYKKDEIINKLNELLLHPENEIQQLKHQLLDRENEIQQMKSQLFDRENEIQQLKSQLDKFQSVILYGMTSIPLVQVGRRTRAQGISAEPQSLKSIQELSQQKFSVHNKSDR